jgi:hypothetical protein
MNKLDEKELLEVLHGIEDAIRRNCIDMRVSDQPGVVEGGFMRMHDKMDSICSHIQDVSISIDQNNKHLEVIAKALWVIAERAERM